MLQWCLFHSNLDVNLKSTRLTFTLVSLFSKPLLLVPQSQAHPFLYLSKIASFILPFSGEAHHSMGTIILYVKSRPSLLTHHYQV